MLLSGPEALWVCRAASDKPEEELHEGGWVVPEREMAQTRRGQDLVTQNPANGEALAFFVGGTAEDVGRAVEAASCAFPAWKNYPPPKRGEILLRAAAVLRRRKDELGELVTKEMGKIIAEGRGEIQEAIDFFEYIAGEGRRLLGETTPSETFAYRKKGLGGEIL